MARWLVVVLIGLGLARAGATTYAPVYLTQVITEARAIFVGRILEVSPVEFDFEQKKHICGFRYRAEIEQALKGPAQAIEFFDPSSDDPLAPGNRFLAFLFSYDVDPLMKEEAAEKIESFLDARYRCQFPFVGISVKQSPRTLMRFSESSDSANWLVIPVDAPYFSEELSMQLSWGRVRWEDLAREIQATLEGPKKTSK